MVEKWTLKKLLEKYYIEIPMLQRDYAQGRVDDRTTKVREKFLDALHTAIEGNGITLDFVYGEVIKENGIDKLFVLDGQQRLTTLFLLYWYAGVKEGKRSEGLVFLKNFSYAVRYSSRSFCNKIVDFTPNFTDTLSSEIVNQSWFPLEWKKDLTIKSMLVMIDSIDKMMDGIKDLWNKINEKITFYFLSINDENLTLSDELYIKMNSRGKPLTDFEHFKAELINTITKIDVNLAKEISLKIDTKWTDLMWIWCYDDWYNTVDTEFIKYFSFLYTIYIYKKGGTTYGRNIDEDAILSFLQIADKKEAMDFLKFLINSFDCWDNFSPNTEIEEFFDKNISIYGHEKGKIRLAQFNGNHGTNLLKNALQYDLSYRAKVLFYAFIYYLINMDAIKEDDFKRRIRIINNLLQNSEDESSSDSETRQGGNRLPAIIKQTEHIMLNGSILDLESINYNDNQLIEEKEKIEWCKKNPDRVEDLFALEDNDLLYGQISIIGLENIDLYNKFNTLFNNSINYNLIGEGLLTYGNYGQTTDYSHLQLGSEKNESWEILFHKSKQRKGFENTKNALIKLLKDDLLNKDVLNNKKNLYIKEAEEKKLFDWKYYYLKYEQFKSKTHGVYIIRPDGKERSDYIKSVLYAKKKESPYSYNPFLSMSEIGELSKEHYGQCTYNNKLKGWIGVDSSEYILSDSEMNSKYYSEYMENEGKQTRIEIKQNSENIDIEDRIQLIIKCLKDEELYKQRTEKHKANRTKISNNETTNNIVNNINEDFFSEEIYYLKSGECNARGVYKGNNEFIILKGSILNSNESLSDPKYMTYHNKREQEISLGNIQNNVVINNIITNSPSESATMLLGHRVSGIQFWKDKNGVSIKTLQENGLSNSTEKLNFTDDDILLNQNDGKELEIPKSKYDINKYLANKSEYIINLYQMFIEKMQLYIKDCYSEATPDYIALRHKNTQMLCEIHLRKNHIDVHTKKPIDKKLQIGEQFPDSYLWSKNYRVRIFNKEDIEIVSKIILDVYNQFINK